jgi:hypothetical protein
MQWEQRYGSLENTQERAFFANPCYTQITQHVFLFQEIINQINFDVRVIA